MSWTMKLHKDGALRREEHTKLWEILSTKYYHRFIIEIEFSWV